MTDDLDHRDGCPEVPRLERYSHVGRLVTRCLECGAQIDEPGGESPVGSPLNAQHDAVMRPVTAGDLVYRLANGALVDLSTPTAERTPPMFVEASQ
ncbi:MAG: hypothetical protein KY447_09390 [Actinobacteria bacterium]|nr:hypothetical protein [Actinomycetota bacterium]